jgi:pimeloyl-ACP methyl ester carboxylesterase
MRAFPQSIRSVVLDSVVPLEASAVAIIPSTNTDHALEQAFALCAASPSCDRSYPNLRETYLRVVARLTAQPANVPFSAAPGGTVQLSAQRFFSILFNEMYAGPAGVPKLIAAADRGDYTLFPERLSRLLQFSRFASDGMQFSAVCHTLGNTQPHELRVAGSGLMTGAPWAQILWAEICQRWPTEPLDPAFRAAIHSEIPTLIFAGELDPVTPPSNGQRIAPGLPNSTYVEMPAGGHGAGLGSTCGRAIIAAFLDDPTLPLDTSCIHGPPVGFSLP